MTSKIKVDNINKVSDDSNIINKCGTTITLGASGDTINLAAGASQTGFGRTGTVDWETTPKVTGDSPVTAVSGTGYFLNTTAGTITINLPAGSAGDIVSMADYAATWATYNVTVTPNGTDKIGGTNDNATLNTDGQSVTFVYVDGVQGWVNTMDSTSNVRGASFMVATVSGACNTLTTAPCCANAKVAKFVNPGTFCVSAIGSTPANNTVSYLVVAGGAGGGSLGGGGGAGGFREYKSCATPYTSSPKDGNPGGTAVIASVQAYPIVVGGGGSPGPNTNRGGCGVDSTFSTITSTGGGGGGAHVAPQQPGLPGGSGGGGGLNNQPSSPAGSGNTPATVPTQGTDGGIGINCSGESGGGGGGATVAGTAAAVNSQGGPGGAGGTTNIVGTPTAYGGGGGGGGRNDPSGHPTSTGGTGGTGGGGNGIVPSGPACSGVANTGGGGGGSGYSGGSTACSSGGGGGSGIVIIRYKFQ